MGRVHDVSDLILTHLKNEGFTVTSETGRDVKESSTSWKDNIRVQVRVEMINRGR